MQKPDSNIPNEWDQNGWIKLIGSLLALGATTIIGEALMRGASAGGPRGEGIIIFVLAFSEILILSFAFIGALESSWPELIHLRLATLTTIVGCATVWILYRHGITVNENLGTTSQRLGDRQTGDLFIRGSQLLTIFMPFIALLASRSHSRRIFMYVAGASSFWWLITLVTI